jgi:hypothetical protein
MTIDLDALAKLHPDLPDEVAGMMALGAAISLQRRHEPGVVLTVALAGDSFKEELVWKKREASTANKVDENRATEDGAEAIALGVVGHHRPRWRLVRRLQSRLAEGADWLFAVDPEGGSVVLEISGTDTGSVGGRETLKRAQAVSSPAAPRAATCVVRFLDPKASFWESEPDGPR